MSEHVYVYCAVEGSPEALPEVGMPDGGPPRTLPLQGAVSLIVSDVPAALYNASSLEPKLADLDWVAVAGDAHHAVVDAFAEAGFVVCPFDCLRSSPMKARRWTRSGARCRPWRVLSIAYGAARNGCCESASRNPARAPGVQASAPASSGTGFLRAKADARREELARAERVKHDALTSFEALAKLADAATSRPVDPAGSLLCDGALLVPPSRVEAVREALTRSAERLLRDGCPVSLTGPWPPYSFASLDAPVDG